MVEDPVTNKPRWLRDLVRFLSLKSQFVLTGNIRDLQAYEMEGGAVAAVPLSLCLDRELRAFGYRDVIAFAPMQGFSLQGGTTNSELSEVMSRNGLGTDNAAGMGLDVLTAALEPFTASTGEPAALIIDFASRLVNRSDALSAAEHALFTRAQILSHTANTRPVGDSRKPFYNSIIWIAERETDLPDWLTLDNPKLRHIPVAPPDNLIRRSVSRMLICAES
ncbi:hypothetical protein [Aminobacter aminovorans]|uniref:hypothetical protein n=1 Tax=Aminobacter aminovorans TaxID=83263 RepID=UPI00285D6725|nr:hypothetical protein [Aminobacter aminovorans]MDR7223720.1 hypothetical protein [Aminobacter aminovorans]